MVQERGITEGYWGIYVRFGIKAINAGESDNDLRPTAIVPIVELGLQKFPELNNLSVDAAEVNPTTARKRPGARSAAKKKPTKK
jgi:hypothetical protein